MRGTKRQTPAQRHAREWIRQAHRTRRLSESERTQFEGAVRQVYEFIGMSPPHVAWVSSPLQAAAAAPVAAACRRLIREARRHPGAFPPEGAMVDVAARVAGDTYAEYRRAESRGFTVEEDEDERASSRAAVERAVRVALRDPDVSGDLEPDASLDLLSDIGRHDDFTTSMLRENLQVSQRVLALAYEVRMSTVLRWVPFERESTVSRDVQEVVDAELREDHWATALVGASGGPLDFRWGGLGAAGSCAPSLSAVARLFAECAPLWALSIRRSRLGFSDAACASFFRKTELKHADWSRWLPIEILARAPQHHILLGTVIASDYPEICDIGHVRWSDGVTFKPPRPEEEKEETWP